jgi:carbon-monoxide dehydrogenase large subunit
MAKYGIGQAVSRFEDPRLLQGGGRFIDDVNLPGQAHAVILRSPHAHARIVRLDAAAARALPGVLGIFTQADLAADGLGTTRVNFARKRPDGSPLFARPHPGLAKDRVRFVGEPSRSRSTSTRFPP